VIITGIAVCLVSIGVQTKTAFMTAEWAGRVFRFNAVSAAGFCIDTSNVSVNVNDGKSVKLREVVHGDYQAVLSDTAKTIAGADPKPLTVIHLLTRPRERYYPGETVLVNSSKERGGGGFFKLVGT
jgi:hypothetical protein